MRMKSALVLAFGLTVSGAAQAKSPNAAQVFTQKNTQVIASVQFGPSVICADGSVGTANGFGFIIASDTVLHSPGSPKTVNNGGFIEVFGYSDSCTGTFIGFGQAQLTYTAPANPQLNSASVSASGFIQDFDTGASYPLTVNVVFNGTGDLQANKQTDVFHYGNGSSVQVTRSTTASRSAGLTGTIDINGVEPDFSSQFALIIGNGTGSVVVQPK